MSSIVADLEDRISSLPDDILCHILSLMPSIYSFQMSVLSTRWKHLPLRVPTIFLDESSEETFFSRNCRKLFCRKGTRRGYSSIKHLYNSPKFISFISNKLVPCETLPISEFRLDCIFIPHVFPGISVWIRPIACLPSLKVLEINEEPVSYYLGVCLLYPPIELFLLKNLVVLKLDSRHIVNVVLCLVNVVLRSESEDFRFTEGYPLVEDLKLQQITFEINTRNNGMLRLCLPSLQKLKIVCDAQLRGVHIDTPNLRHLEWDSSKMEVCLRKCESLVYADLSQSDTIFSPGEWYFKVMSRLSNIKMLHLMNDPDSEIVATCGNLLPPFSNLTNLHLESKVDFMWILLQNAPNLKVLEWLNHIQGN